MFANVFDYFRRQMRAALLKGMADVVGMTDGGEDEKARLAAEIVELAAGGPPALPAAKKKKD